jgi:Tfp pilus assembly protein PilO
MLAIGVLATCPALYFSTMPPAQERLQTAQANARSLHERIARSTAAMAMNQRPVEEQLTEFYRIFPGEKSSPQWLEKLLAVAETHGLAMDQGEYTATPDKTAKLVRFQITIPMKGEYLKIRKFLAALPTELPIIALESVQFQRQKIADPVVEAKIRLVLYLGLEV